MAAGGDAASSEYAAYDAARVAGVAKTQASRRDGALSEL